MGPLRSLSTSKAFRFRRWPPSCIVAAVVVGVEVTKGAPTYPINVVYSSAPGLFTGAAVDVLGVKVGTVTNVQNVGDKVDVTLAVDQGTHIPCAAFASLVAAQLLGSPDVDLNPGYTGGPFLASGATIPQDHTAVPVSTDELLKELQHTLDAINPHAVGNLVTQSGHRPRRPGGEPQQADRVGGGDGATAGRQRGTTSASSTARWPS